MVAIQLTTGRTATHPADHNPPSFPTRRIAGLTNRTLRELIAGIIPGYSRSQMTYDLRRLRRKGLIRRAQEQRYELTDHGRMIAVFFTKTYVPILNHSLGELDPPSPRRSPPITPSPDTGEDSSTPSSNPSPTPGS